MTEVARGNFAVTMVPEPTDAPPGLGRFELTKMFTGDLTGTAAGTMLSAGDPASGSAGYVVVEVVTGEIGDRSGNFALQHLGTMRSGDAALTIVVVPGSGTGDFVGMDGTFELIVDDDGSHRYVLEFTVDAG